MDLISIVAASILGSGHCAAMCGGFAFLASRHGNSYLSIAFYHLGRLCSFVTLGCAAALLGWAANDLAAQLCNVSKILGALMLVYLAWRVLHPQRRSGFSYASSRLLKNLYGGTFNRWTILNHFKHNPPVFSFTLGLFTGFLPCGWLYAFIALNLAAASVFESLLIMFAFWLGTLPLLTVVGLSPNFAIQRIRFLNTPRIKAALMLSVALLTLFPRFQLDITRDKNNSSQIRCHSGNRTRAVSLN